MVKTQHDYNKEKLQQKALIDQIDNKKVAKKIDIYTNSVIDTVVVNKDIKGYTPENVLTNLININKPKIDKEYEKVIKNKKTPDTLLHQVEVQKTANDKAVQISQEQYDRLMKNIEVIQGVLNKYEVSLDKYKELNKKYPKTKSRKGIVTESISTKNYLTGTLGTNIQPHFEGYKELSPLTEGLHRQAQNEASRDLAKAQNEKAISNGEEPPNTHKTWIWTGAGATTRHTSNHKQTVPIDEPFIIVNDVDGRVDEMMYPLDPNVYSSNGFICYCEVEYHNNKEEDKFSLTPNMIKAIDDAIEAVHKQMPKTQYDTEINTGEPVDTSALEVDALLSDNIPSEHSELATELINQYAKLTNLEKLPMNATYKVLQEHYKLQSIEELGQLKKKVDNNKKPTVNDIVELVQKQLDTWKIIKPLEKTPQLEHIEKELEYDKEYLKDHSDSFSTLNMNIEDINDAFYDLTKNKTFTKEEVEWLDKYIEDILKITDNHLKKLEGEYDPFDYKSDIQNNKSKLKSNMEYLKEQVKNQEKAETTIKETTETVKNAVETYDEMELQILHEQALKENNIDVPQNESSSSKLDFNEIATPQECADYFNLQYDGVLEGMPNDSSFIHTYMTWETVKGKVHQFTDPSNENCKIYIFDDLLDTKTGKLKSEWYEKDYLPDKEYYDEHYTEDELQELIEENSYDLKQFFKDYDDLPIQVKKSIGEIVFDLNIDGANGDHKTHFYNSEKSMIRIHRDALERSGFGDEIKDDVRSTLFHEASHSFSHHLGYLKDPIEYELGADYIKDTKEYKTARKEDKKLNGDKYATAYAKQTKSYVEEQADVGMVVLLKHLQDTDPHFKNRTIYLEGASKGVVSAENMISIDEFIERYPNRCKVMADFLGIDITAKKEPIRKEVQRGLDLINSKISQIESRYRISHEDVKVIGKNMRDIINEINNEFNDNEIEHLVDASNRAKKAIEENLKNNNYDKETEQKIRVNKDRIPDERIIRKCKDLLQDENIHFGYSTNYAQGKATVSYLKRFDPVKPSKKIIDKFNNKKPFTKEEIKHLTENVGEIRYLMELCDQAVIKGSGGDYNTSFRPVGYTQDAKALYGREPLDPKYDKYDDCIRTWKRGNDGEINKCRDMIDAEGEEKAKQRYGDRMVKFAKQIKEMNETVVPNAYTSYRGNRNSPHILDNLIGESKGKTEYEAGMRYKISKDTCTSITEEGGDGFIGLRSNGTVDNVLITMLHPPNTNGIYLDNKCGFESETEIIKNRGAEMQLLLFDEETDTYLAWECYD